MSTTQVSCPHVLGLGFGVLCSANALSNAADGLAFVSLLLFVASMTNDARLVAGLATLLALVRTLVALPTGVFGDRCNHGPLIVAANPLRGIVLLSLAPTIQLDSCSGSAMNI